MKIGTSAIRALGRRSGFTLLELLVVLAIMGVLMTLVPALIAQSIPGAELNSAAREITAALRSARSDAILYAKQTRFVLDVDDRSYAIGDQDRAGRIAGDLSLALVTAQRERAAANVGAIRFFPDGSSTGGEITLGSGKRSVRITVQWLTGKVVVENGAPG